VVKYPGISEESGRMTKTQGLDMLGCLKDFILLYNAAGLRAHIGVVCVPCCNVIAGNEYKVHVLRGQDGKPVYLNTKYADVHPHYDFVQMCRIFSQYVCSLNGLIVSETPFAISWVSSEDTVTIYIHMDCLLTFQDAPNLYVPEEGEEREEYICVSTWQQWVMEETKKLVGTMSSERR